MSEQKPFAELLELEDWKIVIVESPYKASDIATVEEHEEYLERCLRDCVLRGETPYASHKMLTKALNDKLPVERRIGMRAGLSLARQVVSVGIAMPIFYEDYGFSDGMQSVMAAYQKMGHLIYYDIRRIGKNPPKAA